MGKRRAFVDDMQAAKNFATGDVVRRMSNFDTFLTPYVGRVIYSNPKTGKVHVQWPWGAEEEPATELVRDASGDYEPNDSLDQWYPTLDGTRFVNDEATVKADEKWRKGLASRVARAYLRRTMASRVAAAYEERTKPVWRAACRAFHRGLQEINAYRTLLARFEEDYGEDCVRLTVSNLYELGRRLAIYWKDGNRRYKVTRQEKNSGRLKCPRCSGRLKPRVYRHQKTCMQCKACGFSISPKDLIWPDGPKDDAPSAEVEIEVDGDVEVEWNAGEEEGP